MSGEPSGIEDPSIRQPAPRDSSNEPARRGSSSVRSELPDGLPAPRRYWAVLTLMSVLAIVVLDSTMVNVALPTIAKSLDIAPADVVSVVIAYSLTVVVTLLPFSAIAERIGFRRMFGLGVVLFGLASLGAALSTSLFTLLLARVAQGVGSSMVMCLFGGFVRNIYPLRKLSMGLSLNASMVGVTAVLGPTIGAWILALASWPWIFLINLPICVLACLGMRTLPDVPRSAGKFDWAAALLSMPVLGLAILGLEALGSSLFTALSCFVGSAVFAHFLFKRSRHQTAPLVPVDLLRIITIRYAVVSSLMLFAAQTASFVTLPFYFQRVLNYSYAEIGIVLGAWSVGTAVMAPVAAYMTERYSIASLCAVGAGVMGMALTTLLLLPHGSAFIWFMLTMLVGGIGFGFFQTPNNRALLTGAPRRRSGAAGALQATTRVFGQSVGTALVAMVFALGGTYGAALGIGVAIMCAVAATVINVIRRRHHYDADVAM